MSLHNQDKEYSHLVFLLLAPEGPAFPAVYAYSSPWPVYPTRLTFLNFFFFYHFAP